MESESKPASEGLLSAVTGIFGSLRRVAGNFIELVTQEVRRAGLTLMWLVALATVAALLIVTAWLGLMVVLALWIVSLGTTWVVAIALVALANLLAACVVIVIGILLSRNLLFPATRRQISGRSSDNA